MDEVRAFFGQRVRELRRQKGLSQTELAERADLNRAYLGGVERGDRNPTIENVAKIAKALEEPMGSLFALSADSAAEVGKDVEDDRLQQAAELFSSSALIATLTSAGGLAGAAASALALSALGGPIATGGAVAVGGIAAMKALMTRLDKLEKKFDDLPDDGGGGEAA